MARNVILSFGLVSIEVSVNKATDSALQDVALKTANRATGNPLVQQYVDEKTEEVVKKDDQAKGVFVGDEFREIPVKKLDEIQETIKQDGAVLELQFVPRDTVPALNSTSLDFLKPRKGYEKKLGMLAAAMKDSGMAFIATFVPTSRQKLVVGFVDEDGSFKLATMLFAAQVRDAEPVITDVDAKTLGLAKKLIKASSVKDYTTATKDVVDEVVAMRREAIDAVIDGKPAPKPKKETKTKQDLSLEDMLEASLNA